MRMINRSDLEAFGYFDMFQNSPDYEKDPVRFYSQFVEDKILTKGRDRLIENTLGLAGEAGEVSEKVKKLFRDKNKFKDEDILKELGDVLFYTVALANIFGGNLRKVMEMNMAKLDDREQRGVLKGSGDNR
jgi:NTP pyrophosphatase (non-canonical NTP hydrolase)